MKLIRQHPDEGNAEINIDEVKAIRPSDDGFYTDVLLSDGQWVKILAFYDDIKDDFLSR